MEIHCSSVCGGCEDTIEKDGSNDDPAEQPIDWARLLRDSEDVLSLTRLSYDSDSSSQTSSESIPPMDEVGVLPSHIETPIIYKPPTYPLYSCPQLEEMCNTSLQSEYWLGNNCSEKSKFLKNLEKYLSKQRPEYYISDVKKRVTMTEYQWVREVLDILQGARMCTIWNVYRDRISIANNHYKVSKKCKLSSISCATLDNISVTLATLATSSLHIRVARDDIIDQKDLLSISPPIIAFGERLHAILDEFCKAVRMWEDRARGNVGLSIFELENVTAVWATRLAFIDDILICATSGRFEALNYHSTVVTLLDLLYRLMNESCLLAIDSWTISTIHQLFFYTFRPYLFSLDALLSGQTHISSTNLFLVPNDLELSFTDIHHYYYNHFTIKKTASQSLITTIPLLLHPFVVKLVSTIKSIDLLRLLSIELTKPSIVNSIVRVPGSFVNHFNMESKENVNLSHTLGLKVINKTIYDNPLFNHIVQDLINSCKRQCTLNYVSSPTIVSKMDLVESCRLLHHNILLDISERYRSVNNHLISVYIEYLGLDKALNALKSVYFLQAGVEMYDFTRQLFMLLVDRQSISELNLHSNLKLQQVLSDSVDINLRPEASNFIVKVSLDNVAPISSEQSGMIAILSSGITIDYKVPWGLRLLVTDDILNICNCCFRFLLQLRFAKHCLEFSIQTERNTILRLKLVSSSIHLNRMRALRLKLLQIINSFHIYIMNTFIVPAWINIDTMITNHRTYFIEDFTDFIHRISEPFNVMARGCLQIDELTKFRKAIDLVISLAVNASQVNDARCSQALLEQLETEYKRLIDFISAMFKGLFNMGISINGLDMGAFK